MNKIYCTIVGLLLVSLMAVPVLAQEVEPNDTIVNASPLTLNVLCDAQLSVADTIDFFSVDVENTNMYLIGTVTNFVFNAEKVLNMDVVGADGVSVLNSSPNGRYKNFGARLTGWIPPATGTYYVKIWSTEATLATVADASYQMRFWYGTPIATMMVREPDNTAAESDAFGDTPTDGTKIYGYIYNDYTEADTFRTNWNDIDLYRITVPQAGMKIIAETFTPALEDHPTWVRDTDTKIYLFDAAGNVTPINNDDKDPWTGDPWDDKAGWFSNTCSRFVSPEVPAAGTYYVGVASVYNSIAGLETRKPHESDKNPGGGEYYVSVKVVSANDPSLVAQNLPLNEMKDGSISASDTMDVWSIYAESDKMYSIATQTDPAVFNAKSVLKMDVVDENNVSVLNSSPAGRYEKFGCILRGWVPDVTGVYYVKIWGTQAALAAEANPAYQMRFWYGTPLEVATTVHEPDDSVEVAVNLPAIPTDGTIIRGYLYNNYVEGDTFRTNWNDFDLYKVEVPEAGMIMTAETFTPGREYGHPEWIRETDTEIILLDAAGVATPIKNDDKDVWIGDPWENILGFNNTFSRFVSPPIPSAGTWYVHVASYYNSRIRTSKPHESHRNAGGGEYLLSVRLVKADDPSLVAQVLPLNEMKAGSVSASDTMDVWAIFAENDKMYTLATQTDPAVFNAKNVLKMDVVTENNVSILNSSPSGRYENFGCILRGWVPDVTGVYYVKIWGTQAALAAEANPAYQMRFWYGTPLEVAAKVHEPDDSASVAVALPAIPTDGTVIRGYLYNNYVEGDTFRTNWNDFDLYKVEVPTAGMILTAETVTPGRLYDHPEWIRETDTEIILLDGAGVATPIKNDDKDVWAGDPWENILGFNNTFSRFVSPPIPAAGTYYIHVGSYYNSRIRSSKPHESHRNAGGGEYLLSVSLTMPKEQEPNNDMASANVIDLQTITDAALAADDSVDYFKFWADGDKMYTLNTIAPRGKTLKSVIKMQVFNESGVNVLNADPSGRYEMWGARLSGWIPPESGNYFARILAIVTEETKYQIRLWYGTPLQVARKVHEPDDSVAVASAMEAIDLTTGPFEIHSYLYNHFVDTLGKVYNWNDYDLYKVKLAAGDTLVAETFTAGPDSTIRDLDTEIILLTEDGTVTPIKDDDKVAWAGDDWENILGFNNTFSRFITPPIPAAGIYYVQVNSYFNSRNRTSKYTESDRNTGGGEYRFKMNLKTGTGVADNSSNIPTKFELSQNYPNPFNPTTTIKYSIPKNELVKLTIYNMLGQRVAILVNEKQEAGRYSVIWDGMNSQGQLMTSGVYLFKLEAGSNVQVNKMILLK